MTRHFVTLLAAFGALGANAAVCRPSGSTTLATTTTEASSTVSVGSSTATETSSTISLESSTVIETVSTVSIETSTTITEASTSTQESSTTASTTSPAEPCVETQILVNPSFDDDQDETSWVFGQGTRLSDENTRSQPYGVAISIATLQQLDSPKQFRQTISRVSPHTYRLQYYVTNYSAVNAAFFICTVTPSINGQQLAQGPEVGSDGPIGWQRGEALWSTPSESEDATDVQVVFSVSCEGDFQTVLIALDDTSLTSVCGEQ
ncbi:hypothetical protein N0V84_000629 [Fusarium piperis]|uniref:CBM-cenC domain-containing protein n=1 Tax=Fusarium piperis TaxID=1435070 RepID=A0A9W8WMG0_9HYPO|nr:hypothetical protein N0V84_000629 [Fusarium piperis]